MMYKRGFGEKQNIDTAIGVMEKIDSAILKYRMRIVPFFPIYPAWLESYYESFCSIFYLFRNLENHIKRHSKVLS